MGKQTRLAVVEQSRQVDATVPVGGQIMNAALGQSGLQPGEHKFARRELAATDLVAHDQRPDEAKDQLDVAVDNVHVAFNIKKICLYFVVVKITSRMTYQCSPI